MGFALTDGSVGVQFNDDVTMVMSPNKRYEQMLSRHQIPTITDLPLGSSIDLVKPKDADGVQCTRQSLSADVDPTNKDIADRKFLLHHFEAYMEGKLHAAEKVCERDPNTKTGMPYMTRYWRVKHLMAFRLSNGVLQVSRFCSESTFSATVF
jgi:cell cycle serine/threonine-protein kinase CDC5/MSD2